MTSQWRTTPRPPPRAEIQVVKSTVAQTAAGWGGLAFSARGLAELHYPLPEHEPALAALHPAERESDAAREVRWMIEELRVNLFAQNLGTKHPVSDKRIRKALDALL